MITRGNIAALALTAAVLHAPAALATEWHGGIGLGYRQIDNSVPDAPHYRSPRFDIDLTLGASGSVVDAGIVDWLADGSYMFGRESANGEETLRQNLLQYRFLVGVLRHPSSPASLTLSAGRTNSLSQTGVERQSVGDTTSTSYGAGLSVKPGQAPPLNASYGWNDTVTRLTDQPDWERKLQTIALSSADRTGPLAFNLGYNGTFSRGTYVPDMYDEHTVTASASALMGPVSLSFQESWWLREPRAEGPGAFAGELDSFTSIVNWTPGPARHTWSYHYGHAVSVSDGGGGENFQNTFSYTSEFRLPPERWFLQPSAGVTQARVRRGDVTEDSTSETVGAAAIWRRTTEIAQDEIRFGPTFGFIQSPAGNDLAWALAGTAQTNRTWGTNQVGLTYSAAVASNVPERGTSLGQQLTGSLARPLGLATANASLSASASRQSSPVLGTMGTRSLNATGTLTFPRYSLFGNLTVASTNSAALTPGKFAGDGLLVPLPFDQHYLTARVGGSFSFSDVLSGSADAGWWQTRAPGLPDVNATDLGVSLGYSVGAFSISASDRLTFGVGNSRLNVFYVVARRSFGGGF